jgi:hypothetical protein
MTLSAELGAGSGSQAEDGEVDFLKHGVEGFGATAELAGGIGTEQALIWTFQLCLFLVLPHWSALAPPC